MRRSLETLLTAFLTVAASAACAQDRPNIVIFHCHDLGQYLHGYDPQRSIRTETHKLIANFSTAPSFQDPSQQWRPRSDPAVPQNPAATFHPHLEFYDLAQDPWEQVNLVDKPEHATVRSKLARSLHQHMVETDDPLLRGAITPPQHETTLKLLQGEPAASKGTP